MLMARAFCTWRRNAGLEPTSPPPALTAMLMSLAIRANCFAMRSQRANIVCLRTSNMRPIRPRILPDVAHGDAHIANVDVAGRMQVPVVVAIAARFDDLREYRAVVTQHFEVRPFGFRHVGGESQGLDRHALLGLLVHAE